MIQCDPYTVNIHPGTEIIQGICWAGDRQFSSFAMAAQAGYGACPESTI